ncbi:MAG: MarR family transcriptional regulator [Chakrabartia sp.]
MGQLTAGLANIEQQFRLRAITPEFEILLRLYEQGPTPSASLRGKSRTASAAFSLILKRLVGSDLLQVEHDRADRRVRKYDLTPSARSVIRDFLKESMDSVTSA